MKRSGFQIAGGVLEIVAGAFWLAVSLMLNNFAKYFGLKLDILQIIMPICFIIYGALACTGKRRKSDVVTTGILNIFFIVLQFFWGTYLGLGIVQMVLLFVAALMFFIAPKLQSEIEFKKVYKEYVANEPRKIKTIRRVYLAVCLVLGLLFNLMLAFCVAPPLRILSPILFILLVVVIVISFAVSLIFGLICNRKRKQYKLTANICFMMLALVLCLCLQIFMNLAFYYNKNNDNDTYVPSQSIVINDDINLNDEPQVKVVEIDGEQYYKDNNSSGGYHAEFSQMESFQTTITIKSEKEIAICGLVGCGLFLIILFGSYTYQYNLEVKKIIKENKTTS